MTPHENPGLSFTLKAWQKGRTPLGPSGVPYIRKITKLEVPSGRHWVRDELTCHYRDGATHTWSLNIPQWHSMLQEPHGGEPCATEDRYYRDPRPDRYPNNEWAQLATQDGSRQGRGTVTLTIRLENRLRDYLEVTRTALECNMRRDLEPIVKDFPPDIAL